MALAGAFDALVFFVVWWSWRGGYVAISGNGIALKQAPAVVAVYLVVEVLSGAAAGCLAKIVGDALVPTGALDGFPIAAHRAQEA
jgi:hypothetical protein